ncbi:MAG: hypothetical protein DRJ09_12475 [Bacteroidetes bacterium]|nr:MAG: hypothetical protein DRJ09_12475 [Bacteroidota bacterium]
MRLIVIAAIVITIISFLFDKKKTLKGIKKGVMMFLKILPVLMSVMILVSIVLYFVSENTLVKYLGSDAGMGAYVFAAVIGAVSIIPSFISYPLAGVLVKTGVSYSVISVFINALKMVGVLTIPIEAKFLGYKISILRNIFAFIGALIVGGLMALIYSMT